MQNHSITSTSFLCRICTIYCPVVLSWLVNGTFVLTDHKFQIKCSYITFAKAWDAVNYKYLCIPGVPISHEPFVVGWNDVLRYIKGFVKELEICDIMTNVDFAILHVSEILMVWRSVQNPSETVTKQIQTDIIFAWLIKRQEINQSYSLHL